MRLWKNKKIRLFFVTCLFVAMPFISVAKDYDYYVDGSVSKSGDGSKDEPFKTISEALEKGGDIFVEKGKYNEDIELKKSTKIFGESENGVIISGKVVMNDDTKIQDLTARGVRNVITVSKDADAEIENCTITDFGRIGILAVGGSGKLKVSDSKIINGDGKGFYIEGGKEIELLNNEVTDCDGEEGIDIRHKVKGIIKGNLIINNGESGIELIVGSSDLLIEKNTIERNGSSGIATQFYPDPGLNGKGQVNINNNSIGENRKYGLDCNRPQGGSPGSSYWKDSIELEGNNIFANKMKSINDYCNLIDAVDDDESLDNTIEDAGYEAETTEDETEPRLTEEEKNRMAMEEELERQAKEEKLKEIELLIEEQESFGSNIAEDVSELKKESKIKVFFWGVSPSKTDDLLTRLNEREQRLEKIRLLTEEVYMESGEEISLQETLDSAKNEINQQKEIIDSKGKSFSLFGWVRNIF